VGRALLTTGNRNNGIVGGTNFRQPPANLLSSITEAQLLGGTSNHRHVGRPPGISARRGPQTSAWSTTSSSAPTGWPRSPRLLQTQANTNIASTPNLVTLDNEEAKIVGRQPTCRS